MVCVDVVQRPHVNGHLERRKLLVAQSAALFSHSTFSTIVQSGARVVVVVEGVEVVVVGVVVVVLVVVVDVEAVLGPAVVVKGSGQETSARRISCDFGPCLIPSIMSSLAGYPGASL